MITRQARFVVDTHVLRLEYRGEWVFAETCRENVGVFFLVPLFLCKLEWLSKEYRQGNRNHLNTNTSHNWCKSLIYSYQIL